jgi:hypothetical protein
VFIMIKKLLHFLLPGNRYQKLLFLFYILISLPLQLIQKPGEGLTQSWRISINLALKNNLQWGSDYVFTFGPLGYLYTRLASFVPAWHIIAFTFFVWLNILFIARYFILSSKIQNKTELLIGAIIALMFSYVVKIEVTTAVMYVVIFCLLYSIKHDSISSLAVAITASTLNLFIKLNYFLPILFIFCLYYLMVLLFKEKIKIRKYVLPALIVQLLVIYLIAIDYNVNIVGYIKSGWYLANSYNDAMFWPVFHESIVSGLFYMINPSFDNAWISFIVVVLSIFLTLPIIYVVWKNRKKIIFSSLSLLTVLFSFLFLFISFKFAFVRHGGLTYLYPPLPLFIFAVLTSFAGWRITSSKKVVIMMVILAFIPACFIPNYRVMSSDNYSYSFLVKKIRKSYRKHFSGKNVIETSKRNNINYLPDRVKEKIGNSTVDIIPLEISIAYFNNLNYNPRPVVQSYAAYNKYLDDLNYSKYISSTSPEYLIYKNESIDKRYHFFDEGRTKLAIRQRYVVVDSFNGNLLLKKTDTIRQLHIIQKKNEVLELNKVYGLSQNQYLQYATFDIRYSKRGSLMRFLFQPPEVNIKFILEDGRSVNHRLIITTLQNPVLLSSYIENNTDAWNFFSGNKMTVKKIRQMIISAPSWAYEKDIILQLQDVQFR